MPQKLIALSTALLLCSTSHASEWRIATGSDNGLLVYIDAQSLRYTGSRVKVWEKWTYESPQKTGDVGFQSAKILYVYDCASRSGAMIKEVLYSGEDGGEVVKSTTNTEASAIANLEEVIPDSVADGVLLEVCKRPRPKK